MHNLNGVNVMIEMISVKICIEDQIIDKKVLKGTAIIELAKEFQKEIPYQIIAVRVKNAIRELTYTLKEDCLIHFVHLKDIDGNRIYQRSLAFVYIRAVYEVLGKCDVTIEHSLNKGIYSEIKSLKTIDQKTIELIQAKMREIINRDEPIIRDIIPKEKAIQIFESANLPVKVKSLKYRESETVSIYTCGWFKDYLYGYMVPSTGYLSVFELRLCDPGLVLRFPMVDDPRRLTEYREDKKLAAIFKESEEWCALMGISYVADLNMKIENNQYGEIIRICEALHEKKIAQIADTIAKSKKRIILIAGPSSSGKTTFAQRLSIQLMVNGFRPIALSTDDYFQEREKTPKDELGQYNFEDIEAVDVELFNNNLNDLLEGKEVDIPVFNFLKGKKEFGSRILKIDEKQPIIIEGIHGLNKMLTSKVKAKEKFKIYISALTQLNLDDHNRIPTTDTRILRRIVRDHQFRGHSAKRTLELWDSVRKGEEKNIFPFQEEADAMFNSSLVYELAVLKKYAEPLLKEIKEDDFEFSEAKRLLNFLSNFLSIADDSSILNNSIIREFIGNSCFFK